jgi:hypothetical protein
MDVLPDVALVRHNGRASVHSDTDDDRSARERLETAAGRRKRTGGRWKRNEERVALGIDLNAVVLGECGAEQAPMLGERLGVSGIAKSVQQPR